MFKYPFALSGLLLCLVTPVLGGSNTPPVIVDGGGAPEDTIMATAALNVTITICMGVIDADGDSVDVVSVPFGPFNGGVLEVGDGDTCFLYSPDPGFVGLDSMRVVVCDNMGGCDTAYVIVNVLPGNDPPVITVAGLPIDTLIATTPEDNPVLICFEATDPEGMALDVTDVLGGPDHGSVNGLGDGDTCMTYTPFPNFSGTDTLLAVVCDPLNGCDTAVVIIDVTPLSDPPIITDAGLVPIDTLYAFTGIDVALNVCLDAYDADGDVLDVAGIFGGPSNGWVNTLPAGDTCFVYTPNPGFSGGDELSVVVCDGQGDCDTVLVIITVGVPNIPPIIVDDNFASADTLTYTTPEDQPINVCINAIDLNGDTLELTEVFDGPQNGSATNIADGDTCFLYTPGPDFAGTDTMTAVVCDNHGGCDTVLVIINVTPQNEPPVITDAGFVPIDTLYASSESGVPVNICLDAYDPDNDVLDVTAIVNGPLNGMAGSFLDGDTCFTYASNMGFSGDDVFEVVVCDGQGACDTVVVIVTVATTNIPPIIVDDNWSPADTLVYTTSEEQPITICFNAIDLNGDTLDVTQVFGGPDNGAASGIGDGDTCFTYTPNVDFTGSDTLSVVVCDNHGGCDTVVVIIEVTPVNDPPVIVDAGVPIDTLEATTPQDTPIIICLEATDPDGDALDVTGVIDLMSNGAVAGINDGDTCFTYTPNAGFVGTDTMSVLVCDGNGECDMVTVVITVTPVIPNEPPVAVNDAASTPMNTAVDINVLVNDFDPNGDPVVLSSAFASHGTVVINDDHTITYTPYPLFCGIDTIFYTICDQEPLCDQGIVVVNVPCPENDPPVAADDSISTTQGTMVIVDVLDNDSDPNGDPITVTSADAISGTVVINGDGSITYTPPASFCGVDTIYYTICDPEPLCDEGTVTVTVECPDTAGLVIPQGFSPNNDGHGDAWTIAGLEKYPQASVVIINRWGNEVFNAAPYGNNWDGRSTNGLTWDGVLPAGTYWYVLDLHVEGEEVRTGYVYLNK